MTTLTLKPIKRFHLVAVFPWTVVSALHFLMPRRKVPRNSSNSRKLPLISIKASTLAWGVFLLNLIKSWCASQLLNKCWCSEHVTRATHWRYIRAAVSLVYLNFHICVGLLIFQEDLHISFFIFVKKLLVWPPNSMLLKLVCKHRLATALAFDVIMHHVALVHLLHPNWWKHTWFMLSIIN